VTVTESEFTIECVDCSMNLLMEWFMVHDPVWAETGLRSNGGCLCVGCLESRIGRELRPDDFPTLPVNRPGKFTSDRLLSRLGARLVFVDDGAEIARDVAQPWLEELDNPPARRSAADVED
jgi:hypothetical protein